MINNRMTSQRSQTLTDFNKNRNTPSILNSRLEIVAVLAKSLLFEIERLKHTPTYDLKGGINFEEEVKQFEMELIRNALLRVGGHQRQAAVLIQMKPSTLNSKIKRYGISVSGLSLL